MPDNHQRILQEQQQPVIQLSSNEARHLVFMFHEMCDYYEALSNKNDDECLALIDLLDKTRLEWLDAYNESQCLRESLSLAEQDATALRSELKTTREQLKDVRAHIATLLSSKHSNDIEIREYEQKLEMIRAIKADFWPYISENERKKLAFLDEQPCIGVRARVGSVDDDGAVTVDYDKSDESLDEADAAARQSKRVHRKHSKKTVGNNKQFRADVEELDAKGSDMRKIPKDTPSSGNEINCGGNGHVSPVVIPKPPIAVCANGVVSCPPRKSIRPSKNRSSSAPRLSQLFDVHFPPSMTEPRRSRMLSNANFTGSALELRSATLQSRTVSNTIDSRQHCFTTKRILSLENCDVCKKRFGFTENSSKCQECLVVCHEKCRPFAPMPCIPRIRTPKTPSNQRPRLCDFCPLVPPRVPHIIVHCVVQLERRGVDFPGIYRTTGAGSAVVDLLKRFKQCRTIPVLADVSSETITGCIMTFLQELREPLIPKTSWNEFVAAAETRMSHEMVRVIADLPTTNRDTLAYLCAHWQRVAEMCDTNMMTLQNLATVLGPTVVGYSSSHKFNRQDFDTSKQISVMMALLSMPHQYWTNYTAINVAAPHSTLPTAKPSCHPPMSDCNGNISNVIRSPMMLPSSNVNGNYQRTPTVDSMPIRPLWK